MNPSADTTKPKLKLTGLATRVTQTTFRKGRGLKITPSESVTLDITLSARLSKATIAAVTYPLTLDETTARITTKGRTLRIAVRPDPGKHARR